MKPWLLSLAILVTLTSLADAQPFGPGPGRGPGRGRGGPPNDPAFARDREIFHALLGSGQKIRREVKHLKNGVETVTESDDPKVAAWIQEHVAAMKQRVENGRPIHRRDPLFAVLFDHARAIKMEVERTPKGVRVVETSDDAVVVRLIQAHAQVVSLFVKNGFAEAHRNHAVPRRAP